MKKKPTKLWWVISLGLSIAQTLLFVAVTSTVVGYLAFTYAIFWEVWIYMLGGLLVAGYVTWSKQRLLSSVLYAVVAGVLYVIYIAHPASEAAMFLVRNGVPIWVTYVWLSFALGASVLNSMNNLAVRDFPHTARDNRY